MVKVGDKAPNFNLLDGEKRTRTLQEFLGQKVALVFFLEAFTASCTKELCEFRDSVDELIDLKAQVVGVASSPPAENKSLADKNRLFFPILSDSRRVVFEEYGLEVPNLARRPVSKRAIFIIDENGTVRYKWVSDIPTLEPDYQVIKKVLKQVFPEETMGWAPRVITISRQTGSGGDEIAQKVGKILGYAYFDKHLMVTIGKSIGVSEGEIADFCEDTYRVQSFVDKILQRKKAFAEPLDETSSERAGKTLNEEECLSVIQTIINSLASKGKTVIVGRGGQAILKNKAGVLHVRIFAPIEVRIKRLMQEEDLSEKEAREKVEDCDKAAAEYLQRFYSINWENPALYDLVLNTGKMDLDTAAKIIASATTK